MANLVFETRSSAFRSILVIKRTTRIAQSVAIACLRISLAMLAKSIN